MSAPFQFTQSSPFEPTQISGCRLWLDGSDSTSVSMTVSGSTISLWKDKSGNGNNSSSALGSPQLTTNAINGLSAVRTQTGKYFYFGSLATPANTTTVSAFAVATLNNSGTNTYGRLISFGNTANGTSNLDYSQTGNFIFSREAGNEQMSIYRNSAGPANVTMNVTYATPFLMECVFDGTNGNPFLNGTSNTAFSSSGTFTFNRLGVGVNINTKTDPGDVYDGLVGEVLVYYAALTTQQRQLVEGYLSWKWGLRSNLPSTHPYKNFPPGAYPDFPNYPLVKNFTSLLNYYPTNIPNCVLWLDGADRSTQFTNVTGTTQVTASGQSVKFWKDKSSSANNATNDTNPPTVTFNAQNTYSVLNFSSQYLNLDASKLPNGSTPFTSITILKTTSTSVQVYLTWGITTSGSGKAPQLYFNNYALVADLYGASSISDTTTYNNTYVVHSVIGSSTFSGWDNGNAFSGGTVNISLNTGTAFSYIGTGQVNGALYTPFYLAGQIAEIIVYNRALTTTERQQLEGYLQWKWGIQSTIPSGNPYNVTPPYSTNPFPLVAKIPYVTNKYFLPTSIPSATCTLWLDAADKSTVTGSTVTSWTDKSGQGNTATASVGPTQSTYNKYPVLSFNGSTQFMTSASTVPRTTHTLIAVHRPAVINGNNQGNTSLFRYQATNYIVFPYMNVTTPRGYITNADGTGVGKLDYQNSTLVENSVTTAFNLIIAVISSGSQVIYKNGTQQSSDTETLTGGTSDTLTIGRWTSGLSEYYQGDLAEMIVYNSNLSTVNRQQLEGYLAWKWGIQSNLPSSHPFKLFPSPP